MILVCGGVVLLRQWSFQETLTLPSTSLLEVIHRESSERSVVSSDSPNVVLVVGCTVRRDLLTPYRPEQLSTPFLSQLAVRGTRFEDVIAAAPWTRPAMTAVLTGRHAATVGMVEPGDGLNRRALPKQTAILAEQFRNNGYETIGATANPNLHSLFGFSRGFDTYIQPSALWSERSYKIDGTELLDVFFRTLDLSPPRRPFYAQILFVDAHAPRGMSGVSESDLPKEVQRYLLALNTLDQQIHSLSDGLRDRGLLENTIFVFVSDHGEGLE